MEFLMGVFAVAFGFSLNYVLDRMRTMMNKHQLEIGAQNITAQREGATQLRIQEEREHLSYEHQEKMAEFDSD